MEQVADLAHNWAGLRSTPNREKRVAILLANYPSKNARVGNAVGLDTPASLHSLLLALRDAGYDMGLSLPAEGQELIERLIAASIQDAEFATTAAHEESLGWVGAEQFGAWLAGCPESARKGIMSISGAGGTGVSPVLEKLDRRDAGPTQEAALQHGITPVAHAVGALPGFPIGGLVFGNVFVGIQPARGYDQDPAAVYHSPDLPPPPAYLAFYRWIGEVFGAHAVIHLGKHGNLEWLPGKSTALSAAVIPSRPARSAEHLSVHHQQSGRRRRPNGGRRRSLSII